MYIKSEEFEAIQAALKTLYFDSRSVGDFYVMETCDNILDYMRKIENREIKKRQSLK